MLRDPDWLPHTLQQLSDRTLWIGAQSARTVSPPAYARVHTPAANATATATTATAVPAVPAVPAVTTVTIAVFVATFELEK